MIKMDDYFKHAHALITEKKWFDKFVAGQGFCIICGHDDPLDLEDNHVGGRKNSPVIVSMCRNCHGRFSRKQYSWPEDWSSKGNSPKRKEGLLMRGFSDLIRLKLYCMMFGGTS